jgi:hypothetical protein
MRRYGLNYTLEEDDTCCVAEVSTPPWYIHFRQCSKKRGHGPDGLYCKQHAAMIARGKSVPVGREEENHA